jgi:hypothetical protein
MLSFGILPLIIPQSHTMGENPTTVACETPLVVFNGALELVARPPLFDANQQQNTKREIALSRGSVIVQKRKLRYGLGRV